jgi:hypothetical protein
MSHSPLRDERGAILPIAGAALVVLLVLAALVVDIANWYEHGKTLQTRADAAVLAAGQKYAFPCEASTNALIETTAREYIGSHMSHASPSPTPGSLVTAPYNNLITTTSPSDVDVVFNSLAYFQDGGSDWSDRSDPNNIVTGKPCSREYLDAKITERNIGGFFGRFAGLSFLPSLSRKARVQLFEVESIEGVLPVGVKAFDARSGAVLFVDQGNPDGVPAAKKYLAKDSTSPKANDFPGFVRWTNETDPDLADTLDVSPATTIPIDGDGVGAVIAISSRPACGLNGVVPPCFSLTVDPNGDSVTTAHEICNQGDTTCFDRTVAGTPPTQTVRTGLAHVAAYNPTPAAPTVTQPPVLGEVRLERAPTLGCRASTFVFGDAPCSLRLVADIRFMNGTMPTGRPDADVAFHAYDALGWCPSSGCVLTRDATLGGTWWSTTIPATALADTATDGRNPIKLRWRFGNGNVGGTNCANNPTSGGNNCDGGFGAGGAGFLGNYDTSPLSVPVHRAFSSNESLSGPIEVVRVWENGTQLRNTAPTGGPIPSLYVDIFLSNVVATAPGDPPIALRVTGSQNGTIDCDPSLNFDEEFAKGCKPRYTTNKFTTNPPCPAYSDLWNIPNPPTAWDCVKTQTGVALGNIAKGIKDRVLGGGNSCLPDNDTVPGNYRAGWNWWNTGVNPVGPPTFPGSMFPNFEPTDPRLVTLFITPFGSFQGSGNAIFPISGFGAFYITGWSVTAGDQDPCPHRDTAPEKFLVGHFIKDVIVSGATPSQSQCNPASLTPCVVALVE